MSISSSNLRTIPGRIVEPNLAAPQGVKRKREMEPVHLENTIEHLEHNQAKKHNQQAQMIESLQKIREHINNNFRGQITYHTALLAGSTLPRTIMPPSQTSSTDTQNEEQNDPVVSLYNEMGTENQENPAYVNGTHKDGKFFGKAHLNFPDLILEGKFVNDMLVQGTIVSSQGRMEGMFENGVLTLGKMIHRDGEIHEGKFFEGKLFKGKIILSDKMITSTEGIFAQAKLNGKGRVVTDKYIADGIFARGALVQGKVYYHNPKVSGAFKEGKLSTYQNSTCETLEGKFKNDFLIKGTAIIGKNKLEGNFADGNLHGQGKKINEGITGEGIFEKGALKEGTLLYPNEKKYSGVFEEGHLHGDGKVLTKTFYAQGEFRKGYLYKGTVEVFDKPVEIDAPFTVKAKAEGKFKDNQLIKGTLTLPNGEIHKGVFENHKLHGKGEIINTFLAGKKCSLKGTFENGRFVKGTMNFEGGPAYKGEFSQDKLHGQGTAIEKSEEKGTFKAKGTFQNGEFVKGKITFKDGSSYEGEFKGYELHGFGRINKKYEADGQFEDGKLVAGKITLNDGTVIEGEVIDGKVKAKMTYINGESIEGWFKNGELNGEGCKRDLIGEIYEQGIYKDGKLILPQRQSGFAKTFAAIMESLKITD